MDIDADTLNNLVDAVEVFINDPDNTDESVGLVSMLYTLVSKFHNEYNLLIVENALLAREVKKLRDKEQYNITDDKSKFVA